MTVDEEDLSKAIGRRGQNARLTSKLVNWDVQVRKDESQHEQFEARVTDAAIGLAEELGVDPQIADRLYRAGGVSADMVMQMPADYIAQSIESTEEAAEEILVKARAATGVAVEETPEESVSAETTETSENVPAEDSSQMAEAEEPAGAAEEDS